MRRLPFSGAQPTAQFDLKSYTTLDQVKEDFPRWALLADRLNAKEMPPKPMPAAAGRLSADRSSTGCMRVRGDEIKRLAGDPGIVLARRLTNAEYDYTIRDLTGQDMQVARQFPVDPANTAGFDNSGESLTMSPALLNKYLQARAPGRRPHGAEARRHRFRAPSDAGGNRPRQIRHPAHHGLLPGAAHRLSPIISRPPGAIAIAPRWASRTPRLASIAARDEAQRQISADGLGHPA